MRVCIYGGPGVGKSTLAAKVFYELKVLQYNAGLAQEYIKEFAIHGQERPRGWDYASTFGEQLRREYSLIKLGYNPVITCSPLLLQCVYAERFAQGFSNDLIQMALKFEEELPSVSFFIRRMKEQAYKTEGRWETPEQAQQRDTEIQHFLSYYDIPLILITYNDIEEVLKEITCRMPQNT